MLENKLTTTSQVSLKFKRNQGGTAETLNSLDPNLPPLKPIFPNLVTYKGALRMDYVSHFNLDTVSGSNKRDEIYYAKLDRNFTGSQGFPQPFPNYVQITDFRGSNSG